MCKNENSTDGIEIYINIYYESKLALSKKLVMNIPYQPGIQSPGIYPKATLAHICKESHTRRLNLAAPFVIVKKMELLFNVHYSWLNK